MDGVPAADEALAPQVTGGLLAEVLGLVPDEWLEVPPGCQGPGDVRSAYAAFLLARVDGDRGWLPRRVAA